MSYYPLQGLLKTIGLPKRRCFISYHHADEHEVRHFVADFGEVAEVFTYRGLGIEMDADIIESTDTDYVMRAIRDRYMGGTSVTLVMIGRCSWARRYVDWEIQASLRDSLLSPANGLLAIKLPSCPWDCIFPERLNANLLSPSASAWDQCYAKWMRYPTNATDLKLEVEAAYERRTTHAHLINNPRAAFAYNKVCQ